MMAQILLEYSSDGLPPSAVDRKVRGMGLSRDGAFFVLQAMTEEDMRVKIDRLHEALRGTGARYTISSGETAGIEYTNEQTEPGSAVMSDEDLEGRVEEVRSLLRYGHRDFTGLMGAMDIGEAELEEVLSEMADRGLVVAHRGDDGISYRLAGPMVRSMAR